MSFLWPHMLWLAALVPALMLAERLLSIRRGASGSADVRPQIRRGAVAGGKVRFDPKARPGRGLSWRFWLAVLLAVVAVARPQWGRVDQGPGADAPGEVLIALDLSRSMLAADVAPSRLERARALAARLADELPDRRVGLIGFAGAAHLLAPASEDRAILRAYLPRMGPEHMPEPGSNFAAMLDVALGSFGRAEQGRSLVVLTDGEAEPGAWQSRLGALQGRNVQVIAVGVGTEGGAQIIGPGGKPLLTPAGTPVLSRLNPAPLAELARATGGRSLDLTGARELTGIVRAASAKPPEGAGSAQAPPVRAEQFVWFVLAAAALLAWSAAAEFAGRPTLRRRPPLRAAAQGAMAAALLLALVPPQRSEAAKPVLTEADLQGEQEPLVRMQQLVAALLAKRRLGAADYLQVAEVATRYGEIHRGHGHPLEDGVLHDGVAAVEAGRALDPTLANWAAIKAKLERLLVPPPPAPMDDPGPADPANEPMDAKGEAPVAGEDARKSDGEAGEDKEEPTAGEQGLQNVGGSEKDVYDPAEWRNAALVQPLDQLERLRAADSPAELFLRMQSPGPVRRKPREQTW